MMNTRILDIIKNPEILRAEDLKLLESEIEKLPYMQSLRAIYLLGIHKYDNDNFQQELTKTAAYTTDKKILYTFINQRRREEKGYIISALKYQQEENHQDNNIPEQKKIPTGIDYYTKNLSAYKEEQTISTPKLSTEKPKYETKTHIMDFYTTPIKQNTSPINFYEKPKSSYDYIIDTSDKTQTNSEESTNENYYWEPMIIESSKPIIEQEIQIEETEKSSNPDTNSLENAISKDKKENNIETSQKIQEISKETSNVSSFINTWQNWLKIDRTPQLSEQEKKAAIIDKFIESNPKISPIKEDVEFTIKEKSDDISHLMTETLAQLYVEQKLYTKAIGAYKILQEKHPEKVEYFEQKIEEIKKAKNK